MEGGRKNEDVRLPFENEMPIFHQCAESPVLFPNVLDAHCISHIKESSEQFITVVTRMDGALAWFEFLPWDWLS
jgi:hypothetical protein